MSPRSYFSSSTGKKFLMAASGAVLFVFIIGHLLGNLKIFIGTESLNSYSAFLRNLGELLWAARILLLMALAIHIWTATVLTLENRAARPIGYASKDYVEASYASRTMIWSGLIILVYLVYHLLNFTFMKIHPELDYLVDAEGRHDVYRMVVANFQQPTVAVIYIVANLLLGMHLSHGIYSMFQSLGLVRESKRRQLQAISCVVGYGIFLAYASIPVSVWLGVIK